MAVFSWYLGLKSFYLAIVGLIIHFVKVVEVFKVVKVVEVVKVTCPVYACTVASHFLQGVL